MKKLLFTVTLFILGLLHSEGRNVSAFFSYCTFNQPGKSPYVETYLQVDGSSVQLAANSEHKMLAKIEVQWIYRQDDKIVHFDKYNLLSPVIEDSSKSVPNFIDQQRVPLA